MSIPTNSNNNPAAIPASALPPGADASYVQSMVRRAEAGGMVDAAPAAPAFAPPRAPEFKSKWGTPKAAASAAANDLLVYSSGGKPLEMEVAQAVRMGLVRPAAGGGFEAIPSSEVAAANQQAAVEQQQARQQDAVDVIAKRETGDEPDVDLQSTIERLNSAVPAQVTTQFMDEVVSAGSISLKGVHAAARSLGMTPDAAERTISSAYDGFQRQAARAISVSGVSSDEAQDAYNWMAEHHPAEHKNAVRALVYASDAKGLRALAGKYAASKRINRD